MTAAVVTNGTTKYSASVCNIETGSFTTDGGTPAAVTVQLGFQPRYVKVVVSGTNPNFYEWFDGMVVSSTQETDLDTGSTGVETQTADITVTGPANTDLSTSVVTLTAVAQVADPGLIRGGEHTNVQGGFTGNNMTLSSTIMAASSTISWIALG